MRNELQKKMDAYERPTASIERYLLLGEELPVQEMNELMTQAGKDLKFLKQFFFLATPHSETENTLVKIWYAHASGIDAISNIVFITSVTTLHDSCKYKMVEQVHTVQSARQGFRIAKQLPKYSVIRKLTEQVWIEYVSGVRGLTNFCLYVPRTESASKKAMQRLRDTLVETFAKAEDKKKQIEVYRCVPAFLPTLQDEFRYEILK